MLMVVSRAIAKPRQKHNEQPKTAEEPACKIIGRIFFSRNQLFWVEKLTIRASAHLVHNCRFLGYKLR